VLIYTFAQAHESIAFEATYDTAYVVVYKVNYVANNIFIRFSLRLTVSLLQWMRETVVESDYSAPAKRFYLNSTQLNSSFI